MRLMICQDSAFILYAMTIGRLNSAASSVAVPLAISVTSQAASASCERPSSSVIGRGRMPRQHRLDQSAQSGHHRQHEAQIGPLLVQAFRGLQALHTARRGRRRRPSDWGTAASLRAHVSYVVVFCLRGDFYRDWLACFATASAARFAASGSPR